MDTHTVATVLLSLAIIALAVLGMSVGVLFGRPSLRRGCGAAPGECDCADPCWRKRRRRV